jgi:hypothetical protein
MKFQFFIIIAVALLAGRVLGKKAGGGLRRKTKVRAIISCACRRFSISFWSVLAHRIVLLAGVLHLLFLF